MSYRANTPALADAGEHQRAALREETTRIVLGVESGTDEEALLPVHLGSALRGAARVLRAVRDDNGADSVVYQVARDAASVLAAHWLIECAYGAVDFRLAPHLMDMVVDRTDPLVELWPDYDEDGEPL
jgi:hypothetical protein